MNKEFILMIALTVLIIVTLIILGKYLGELRSLMGLTKEMLKIESDPVSEDLLEKYALSYKNIPRVSASQSPAKADSILETKIGFDLDAIPEPEIQELSFDPFVVSGFTADQYDLILTGTDMEDLGEIIYRYETQYKINGMFILGVARGESGLGRSEIAKKYNNFFGFMSKGKAMSFNSFEECVKFFCEKMKSKLYYGKTIDEIAEKYCPSGTWANLIRTCMESNYNRLIKRSAEKIF